MCKMFQKMTMIYTNLEFHMNKNMWIILKLVVKILF